jgi:CDP-glucose 4,6-dehydratase
VGSWLTRALVARGASVVALLRDWSAGSELVRSGLIQRIDVVCGSIDDQALLERVLGEYEIRTVFHLAAQTIVGTAITHPLTTFESNVRGTWCLLEAARRGGKSPHLLVASSDKAYGTQDALPYREDAPLLATGPYDVSKACADMVAQSYFHTYGLPVCVTRCGNFFGGGDLNWNRIIPGTIRSIVRGERPILRSDGGPRRDYFYVRDGVRAYLHLAERMATDPKVIGEAFNFSNEAPMTVLQVVDLILATMQSNLTPDIRNEAQHEIPHQYLSAEKARRLLGWAPRYEFPEAMRETIAWYQAYLARTMPAPRKRRPRLSHGS